MRNMKKGETRIMKKKLLFILLSLTASSFLLFGCGNKEEEEVVSYDLVAYQQDQLCESCYYVQTGDGFYPVAPGTLALGENESAIATQVNNNRMAWYGLDDNQIPTLYKNQSLVFCTVNQIPSSWVFERYEDLGYTIGIRGLAANSAGRYESVLDGYTLHPMSTAYTQLSALANGTIVGIDRIGATQINSNYVSRGGTITGLSKDQVYSVDVYQGSVYVNTNMTADTHAFASFELYETTDYSYNQSNYVTIKIPDYFVSGYYYINGAGMFKYVANDSSQGISGVNFNTPYYVGYDESGNLITAEQQKQMKEQEVTEVEKASENNAWMFTQSIDTSMENLSIVITYSDMAKVEATDIVAAQLELSSQNGSTSGETDMVNEPKAILTSPNGETYEFTSSATEGNSLSVDVQMPISGDWIVSMTGMENKIFNITSNIGSGHSNSILHSGNGSAQMNYYLSTAIKDAVFDFTWENTERACTIEIIGPDGTKYDATEETEGEILSSGYGSMSMRLGQCIAGNYTIKITGEELGRVRCVTSQYEANTEDDGAIVGGDEAETEDEDTDNEPEDDSEDEEDEEDEE